jgi:hypothetical protein
MPQHDPTGLPVVDPGFWEDMRQDVLRMIAISKETGDTDEALADEVIAFIKDTISSNFQ